MSILGGVLAVVVAAYLAAVRLAADAHRLDDPGMTAYFRRRALGAAIVSGVAVAVGIWVLHADAPYLFDGLTSRAPGIVIGSAVLGGASLVLVLGRTSLVTLALGGSGRDHDAGLGRGAVSVSPAGDRHGRGRGGAVGDPRRAARCRRCRGGGAGAAVPCPVVLFVLDQRSLLPEESVD